MKTCFLMKKISLKPRYIFMVLQKNLTNGHLWCYLCLIYLVNPTVSQCRCLMLLQLSNNYSFALALSASMTRLKKSVKSNRKSLILIWPAFSRKKDLIQEIDRGLHQDHQTEVFRKLQTIVSATLPNRIAKDSLWWQLLRFLQRTTIKRYAQQSKTNN